MASLMAIVLAGCGGYRLEVVSVASPVADARFVPSDRVPAGAQPLPDVRVRIYRDPDSLGEELAGEARTDAEGRAVVRLDAFGAGWMVERWRIEASARGYESVTVLRTLPGSKEGMVLVVELPPGLGAPAPREDLLEEFERFR